MPLLEDAHCLRGLSLLIQLIRNGQLSVQCRTYLLSCPVIPTVKRTGGIRPITIGKETLYKMAAAVALSDVEREAVDLLGPDQFALCPGGPESATLALKAALERCTGASTDIQNAFNSLDRGIMLTQLFSYAAWHTGFILNRSICNFSDRRISALYYRFLWSSSRRTVFQLFVLSHN